MKQDKNGGISVVAVLEVGAGEFAVVLQCFLEEEEIILVSANLDRQRTGTNKDPWEDP